MVGVAASEFTGATVKVGFLNPMTGPIAVYAPGFGVAANVALGMMNIAGWGSGLPTNASRASQMR